MTRILLREAFAPVWRAEAPAPTLSDPARAAAVRAFHRDLPDYAPTPLHVLPDLAAELGVGAVLVKDETSRLGMPAFKMLGASWAVASELSRWLGLDPAQVPPLSELRGMLAAGEVAPTVVAATDGNHGHAVARTSRLLGVRARIHVPHDMAAARIAAIEREGATCIVGDGTWDDAVRVALAEGDATHVVVNDTAISETDTSAPTAVMEGYATIFAELGEQLADLPQPTVAVVQMGCGALAAAVVTHLGATLPGLRVLGVEPLDADCLLQSAATGEAAERPGPHRSLMAGLNCGAPSLLALPTVARGCAAFVAIPDEPALEAVRVLARHEIAAGETGAAGLAGVLAALEGDPDTAHGALGLGPGAVVLLFVTEGPTDPLSYERALAASSADDVATLR